MALPILRRRAPAIAVVVAVLALLAWAFFPKPVPVDVAAVRQGPLEVTADEDAETRAVDRFLISAPVAGKVTRIALREGDPVQRNQIIANVQPLPLSAREREEQLARISATEALAREADVQVRHALADHDQAAREVARVEKLVQAGFIATQGAEQARIAESSSQYQLEAARHHAESARAEAQAARAALFALEEDQGSRSVIIAVRSPATGKVLHIPEKSERVVSPGAPLLTVGDPTHLEVVIDLLSSDAIKVAPGMSVRLEGWGGDQPLTAQVRLAEPQAFTKVSALGVEEQRVNVIADLVAPPGSLGDGFRVEAHVVLWKSDHVLKVPVSALFRHGDDWAAFVVQSGRARLRTVQIGHRGALEVEVLKGLQEGDEVVRHPSNDIHDGAAVKAATPI